MPDDIAAMLCIKLKVRSQYKSILYIKHVLKNEKTYGFKALMISSL
jgi:hypothetical protein